MFYASLKILISRHQAENPNPEPETRTVTRSQTQRANLSPELESRRATSSRNKSSIQDLPAEGHDGHRLPQDIPKERHKNQGETASLNPSREPISQLARGISAWLDEVQFTPIDDIQPFNHADSYPDDEPQYITDTTLSSGSLISSDAASTAMPQEAPRRPQEDILDKLRTRHALPLEPTTDGKTKTLKSTFGNQKVIEIPYKDTKTLQAVITNFLQKAQGASPHEDSYTAIEDLSNEINEWKSTGHLATVANLDFKKDLKYCEHSNEAVFQRTAMISIVDRWRLNNMLDFNCGGHRSLQGEYPLPSAQGLKDAT
ncbi:hypothetical protein F4824DRAFT_514692 [Ustulina deusta]|nr:hypothetical protein F4824DRAFT_514692 [Ustulina deusta]